MTLRSAIASALTRAVRRRVVGAVTVLAPFADRVPQRGTRTARTNINPRMEVTYPQHLEPGASCARSACQDKSRAVHLLARPGSLPDAPPHRSSAGLFPFATRAPASDRAAPQEGLIPPEPAERRGAVAFQSGGNHAQERVHHMVGATRSRSAT